MKFLLIYANGVSEGYLPVGLASLAGSILNAGHDVQIFDTSFYENSRNTDREIREKYLEFKKVDKEEIKKVGLVKSTDDMEIAILKKVKDYKPDLIGVGVTSTEFPFILPFLYAIKKEFDIPILAGGIHPTLVPEKVIKHECIDMLCRGEGEGAIVELLDKIEKKEDITKTENIWVKQDGQIYKNDVRPLIEDLDQMPFPAWHLFDKRHFVRPFEGGVKHSGFFEFTRGCPYSCHYCINDFQQELYKGKGKYHRQKSAKRMIDEMVKFNEYIKSDHNQFVDDMFLALNIKKLREFRDEYQKKLTGSTVIMARPESVSEEKARILKDINCVMVLIGLESGNDKIRKELCNRFMKEESIVKARKLLKDQGIKISTYNMVGFPEETRENIFETIELNRKLQPDRITVKILCPFEGTKIRDICVEKGYINEDEDITKMFYEDTALKMPQLPEEEIRGLRKTFILYASYPKWVWPLIRLCESENFISNFIYYNILAKFTYIGKS